VAEVAPLFYKTGDYEKQFLKLLRDCWLAQKELIAKEVM